MKWLERRRTRHRDAVLRAVRMAPGSTAQEIQSIAHVSWYAVGVHLSELRRQGLVTRYWRANPFAGYSTPECVWIHLEEPDDEQDGDAIVSEPWRSHQ